MSYQTWSGSVGVAAIPLMLETVQPPHDQNICHGQDCGYNAKYDSHDILTRHVAGLNCVRHDRQKNSIVQIAFKNILVASLVSKMC